MTAYTVDSLSATSCGERQRRRCAPGYSTVVQKKRGLNWLLTIYSVLADSRESVTAKLLVYDLMM